jgi:hypothetical protein
MKICVIGNSHVGALKRAWDKMSPAHPGLELVFFAHRGNGMSALKPQGKKLVPTTDDLCAAMKFTSGGQDHIVPADYDAFLIYGLKASPNFGAGERFFSRQVRQQALDDLTHNKLSLKVLKMVRQLSEAPVYLGHEPLNSASETRPDASIAPYESGIAQLNESFYGPLGAEMLMQPPSTMVNGKNTDPSFSKDSQRLAIGTSNNDAAHPEGEDRHMNAAFGEIWLGAFIERLKSTAGSGSREQAPGSSPGANGSSAWSRILKRAGIQ